jgi:hypothetical protein
MHCLLPTTVKVFNKLNKTEISQSPTISHTCKPKEISCSFFHLQYMFIFYKIDAGKKKVNEVVYTKVSTTLADHIPEKQ